MRNLLLSHTVRGILVSGVFWWVVGHGWWTGRLSHRAALTFAALYIGGAIATPYLVQGGLWFVAGIAVIDVALVFLVYGRDFGVRDLR